MYYRYYQRVNYADNVLYETYSTYIHFTSSFILFVLFHIMLKRKHIIKLMLILFQDNSFIINYKRHTVWREVSYYIKQTISQLLRAWEVEFYLICAAITEQLF